MSNRRAFVYALLITGAIASFAGLAFEQGRRRLNLQTEAVERGFAERTVEPDGTTHWQWKEVSDE
jgi:hypothetical protein